MQRYRIGSTHRVSISKSANNRRGVALIYAMIALLLASVIGAALLKTALAQRRQARHEQNRAQSAWLAESGVDRAAAMLVRDANYKGETWNVTAAELGGNLAGQVVIAVAPVSTDLNRRQVTVVADFPVGTRQRSRSRKTIEINLAQLTLQEKSK
jgi:Tfp pilus assembly protein PilV